MNNYKVSIIVPVYNVAPYIEECLQSVSCQDTTDELECILVDDCGTDNSVQLAEDFIARYKGHIQFSLLHHKHNQGLSGARNTGLKVAKGKYVYFLDSDDTLAPDCISTLCHLAERHHADIVIGAYNTGAGFDYINSLQHPEVYNQKDAKRALLNYDVIPVTAANRLIKRSLILDNHLFFKPGIIHEDNYWTFFLAKHVRTMSYCSKPVYYYRQTQGSITHSKDKVKETQAFTTMLRDFCAHIDTFERNAQLRYIFCHLLTTIDCGYYHDKTEKESLLKTFYSSNKFFMRPLLKKIFDMNPLSEKRKKLIRWAIRIYEHLK